jgi:hypothetical protein
VLDQYKPAVAQDQIAYFSCRADNDSEASVVGLDEATQNVNKATNANGDLKWIIKGGDPSGLDSTLTVGIISALKRRLPTQSGHEIRALGFRRRMKKRLPG